jgi:MinD superfamily P-loop ATPase
MKITIASGKGGTGKTTLAVNLAWALAQAGRTVSLLDCDVEEPNDHLFLHPDLTTSQPVTVLKPVLNQDKCSGCGRCAEVCAFNAITVIKGQVLIFPELCHACGACSFLCPEGALEERPFAVGKVERGTVRLSAEEAPFAFSHGILTVGESIAPKVIQAVKSKAPEEVGHPEEDRTPPREETITLIDASPGTACPVVQSLKGSDACILVTEATPFGLHDLKLALALSLKMGIPTGIVINRSSGEDSLIDQYAASVGVPVIGRIPFRRRYAERYSRGEVLARGDADLQEKLLRIFDGIAGLRGEPLPPVPEDELSSFASPAAPESVRTGPAGEPPRLGGAEIGIISGKGGTGKTTLAASLAVLANQAGGSAPEGRALATVLSDTDVDAPDLHLLLKPSVVEARPFVGGRLYSIDEEACTGCGECAGACRFGAISTTPEISAPGAAVRYRIDELDCEGCGLCFHVCPVQAIGWQENINGTSFVSRSSFGPMAHARLGIGEENSGKLVTEVRRRAAELAGRREAELTLSDGPPGVGCPVIAAITGLDRLVIVTEPTVSGAHDLKRVLELSGHFGVPAQVVINKSDLNPVQAGRIKALAAQAGAPCIGEVPFDPQVQESLNQGIPVVAFGDGPASRAIARIWKILQTS